MPQGSLYKTIAWFMLFNVFIWRGENPPRADNEVLPIHPGIRLGHSTVMLSTFAPLSVNSAKHLDAHADRPFAAAQGDMGTHPVMLRLRACPERSEWGDTVRQLRVMRIGADKSAVGAINRPLQCVYKKGSFVLP